MTSAKHKAHIEATGYLLSVLLNTGIKDEIGYDSPEHLIGMINEMKSEGETWPLDKLARWLGYIQGVMFMREWIDVDAERDRTRPLFESVDNYRSGMQNVTYSDGSISREWEDQDDVSASESIGELDELKKILDEISVYFDDDWQQEGLEMIRDAKDIVALIKEKLKG